MARSLCIPGTFGVCCFWRLPWGFGKLPVRAVSGHAPSGLLARSAPLDPHRAPCGLPARLLVGKWRVPCGLLAPRLFPWRRGLSPDYLRAAKSGPVGPRHAPSGYLARSLWAHGALPVNPWHAPCGLLARPLWAGGGAGRSPERSLRPAGPLSPGNTPACTGIGSPDYLRTDTRGCTEIVWHGLSPDGQLSGPAYLRTDTPGCTEIVLSDYLRATRRVAPG